MEDAAAEESAIFQPTCNLLGTYQAIDRINPRKGIDKLSVAQFLRSGHIEDFSSGNHTNVMLSLFDLLKKYRVAFGRPVPAWCLQYYYGGELKQMIAKALETSQLIFPQTDNVVPIEWVFIADPKISEFLDNLDSPRRLRTHIPTGRRYDRNRLLAQQLRRFWNGHTCKITADIYY